jgi:hypothetical protein
MSVTQSEKAARFRALHDGSGAFVIPNPWDVGSARILTGLGFQALATSSAASAAALGQRDGGLTRDEALAHARLIVDATDLPVSADLEKGFGDAPKSWRKRSGLRPAWDSWDARSRIPLATKTNLSMMFTWLSNGLLQPRRPHARSSSPLSWLREHTISFTPIQAWKTLSAAFKPSKKPEPTCFSPPACLTLPLCAQSVRRCRSLSIYGGIKGKSFSVAEPRRSRSQANQLATHSTAAMTGLLDAIREKDTASSVSSTGA